jgi:hypothetical protein
LVFDSSFWVPGFFIALNMIMKNTATRHPTKSPKNVPETVATTHAPKAVGICRLKIPNAISGIPQTSATKQKNCVMAQSEPLLAMINIDDISFAVNIYNPTQR